MRTTIMLLSNILKGLNFEKLHDFPACVYGLLMEGGRALPRAPKLHMNITVAFNFFS